MPSVAGAVVPEPVFTRREYEDDLLGGIYRDLAPLDPEGVLRHEWVNARGAIARFDRGAIEIRVLDVQECPAADLAVAGATIAVVRALVEERHAGQRGAARVDGAGARRDPARRHRRGRRGRSCATTPTCDCSASPAARRAARAISGST